MALYISVFWLQMVAVNAKNTSFDDDLQVLLYTCNFKKTFRYVAGVESSSFYGYKFSKCSSCMIYKNLRGFFNGRFENYHQNLRIFSEIPANLHIVTVTKRDLINCYFIKSASIAKYWLRVLIRLIWCRDGCGDSGGDIILNHKTNLS